MDDALSTRDRLLLHARRQFWSIGYSNVSVRQIASAANADVALISRYFGSKLGLFKATLEGAFSMGEAPPQDQAALVEGFVKYFTQTPRGSEEPSSMLMLLTNAHDEDVGDLIRSSFHAEFYRHVVGIIGSEERAALLIAAVLGISLAEKSLRLGGIGEPTGGKYEAQLRLLMSAALAFPDANEE